jgi:hypothetical protein
MGTMSLSAGVVVALVVLVLAVLLVVLGRLELVVGLLIAAAALARLLP